MTTGMTISPGIGVQFVFLIFADETTSEMREWKPGLMQETKGIGYAPRGGLAMMGSGMCHFPGYTFCPKSRVIFCWEIVQISLLNI